jgi:putative PIN family toxin of toxin-antitoxin system
MSEKLIVIFDTQIFLRALIRRTSLPARISSPEWKGYYVLCVSDAIEAEVLDVLHRPQIRDRFPQITNELVQQTREDLLQTRRITVEKVEAVSRDPKDDMFLACAQAAQADFLVSEDKELVLEQHHTTRIVTVSTFLSILEARRENPPKK